MNDDGSASTAMLGLPGLVLVAVSELDGELEQAVETTATATWCQGCGVQAKPHGRRVVRVRDLPCGGRPTTLLWLKRLWRCAERACPVRTWSESTEHVRPRASLTERARREACRLVGEDGLDVAAVAVLFGVGWGTVMRAVREHGQPLIDNPQRLAGVVAVGVDETAFLAARRGAHTQFVTGIVAMAGPGRSRAQLLDVVPGRTKSAVQDWFSACDPTWRAAIATASLDPFRGYATALTVSLPQAVRVLDAFHVVKLAQTALDEVRRRRQQEQLARRGHAGDPLYQARRDLRRGLHTHTRRSWARTELAVTVGDPSGQLLAAFQISHELQRLYAHAHDQADAAHRLHRILVRCADSTAPELHRLARTLQAWRGELLAYWTATGRRGVSNGPTEATNCMIKKVKRSGHGFRNFHNYRLRLLLNIGLDWRTVTWQAAPATPIRGRQPRLVA